MTEIYREEMVKRYITILALVAICSCSGKDSGQSDNVEVTNSDGPSISTPDQNQATPSDDRSRFKSMGSGISESVKLTESDRQFLSFVKNFDINGITSLVEGGFDLWSEVDFETTDYDSKATRQEPILYAALDTKDEQFLTQLLELADQQKHLSMSDYGSADGQYSVLRFAIETRQLGALGAILKIWPWQLTAEWDDGGSLPERPTIFFAVANGDTETVTSLLNAGFPGDYAVKSRGRGFDRMLTDETSDNGLRELLISHGAKGYVDLKNYTPRLSIASADINESPELGSKSLGQIAKSSRVEILGRTTGPKDRKIKIRSESGIVGFVPEEVIQFDWGQ